MSEPESQAGEMPDGDVDASMAAEGVPRARIRTPEQVATARMQTRLWWLTGFCAILAIVLVVTSFQSQGSPISIHFEDGHGLKPGDTLRYRGIDVGAIQSVTISDDLSGVDVGILLEPGNEKIAVEGSQFWIERARLRIGQVSGLDTVLGAKYVGVIPGQPDSAPRSEFVGLETPLSMMRGDTLEVRIQFPRGEGLEVGDTVKYRGIAVGEVTFVELSETIDSVWVGVRLVGAARSLARVGTHFWIERPRLDLTEVRGLETLLGGRYIAIQPTSDGDESQTEFVGLAEPPPLPRRDGSLDFELDAPSRLGLVRGAPITYRGLEVGRVSSVGLAVDGTTVKVNAVVDAEYADLVRDNSKWWAIGGIKVDANLRGVHIAVDSLSAWIRGGIAFATPESPGERVVTGHRFVLEPEPLAEWLEWQPRIAVGGGKIDGRKVPQPVRVAASWKNSFLGIPRRQSETCWAVCLSDGYLCVPKSFAERANEAPPGVRIEVVGKSFVFVPEAVQYEGAVARIALPPVIPLPAWPIGRLANWHSDMTLLVVNPEQHEPLALDSTRVAVVGGVGLAIAPGVPLSEELDGLPVIDASSGDLVGLLVVGPDGWMIGTPVLRR